MATPYISPNKKDKGANLNHLILSVHRPTTDDETSDETSDYALNEFISTQGRLSRVRIANDFDYQKLRERLFTDLGIDQSAPLYPRSKFENINDEAAFYRCLTQVQKGVSIVLDHDLYRLPYLELWPTDAPAQAPPQRDPPPGVEEGAGIGSTSFFDDSGIISSTSIRPKPPARDEPDDDKKKDDDPDTPDPNRSQLSDKGYDDGHTLMDQYLAPFTNADDDEWKQVCEFFNCSTKDEKIQVLGISIPLLPYQAHTVWRVFRQIAGDRIPSFMIGDAPGLGKTGTSLTIAVIFAMLMITFREVQFEQQNNTGGPRDHLQPDKIGVCPTQGKRVICPCVKGGLSYNIVRALDCLPTIVCCTPGLIPQWDREAEKWIDRSPASPSRGINILVHHYELRQLRNDDIRRISGNRRPPNIDAYKIDPRAGSSSNIVIVSSSGTNQLLKLFEEKIQVTVSGRRGRQQQRLITVNNLGSSLIFYDEYHNYKGGANELTQPFGMLNEIRIRVSKSVMAIGLSASIRQGPEYFRPFVRHAFNSAPSDTVIAGLENARDLETHCNDFSYLVNNLERRDMTDRQKEDVTRRQERVLSFLEEFVPQMVVARKKTTIFRGNPIGAEGGRVKTIQLDMLEGQTRTAFQAISSRVKSYFDTRYSEELRRWEDGGEVGDKPDRRTMVNQAIDEITNNPTRNREWSTLIRSSCFPHVAFLVNEDIISSDLLLVKNINALATPISRLLHPDQRANFQIAAIDNQLNRSPFSDYRATIREQSPKIIWVEDYINTLLNLTGRSTDSQRDLDEYGPPPPDGTNIRHAIVFSESPISAFLSFMVLWDTFRERIRRKELAIIYAHSGVPQKARSEFTRYMQEDCQQGDPVKVLISTTEIFGEGYNLQRINTAIITEIGGSYEKQKQAFGRVDRTGQTMRPLLYQLYDDENLSEKVRMNRNKNRRKLAERSQEGDNELDPEIEQLLGAPGDDDDGA